MSRPLPGLVCMLIAVAGFSLMAVGVKLLGPGFPSHETILVRSLATIPVVLWMLRRRGLSPRGRRPGLLLARGTFGTFGMIAYFVAVAHLPLGNAVLLTHASPVFSALFARWFLGERTGRTFWLAAGVCLAGVALVAKPSAHAPLLWNAIALGSAVLNGVTYTIVRASAGSEHPLVVVLSLPLVAVPITGVLTAFDSARPDGRAWLLLAGVTVTSIVAQIFMTLGIQRETAARATNMFFVGVVLAILWGFALGDPVPGPLTWTGAGLIVAGVVALSVVRGRGPTLARVA